MELGEAELSAYTQGVTLLVQGQLDLREDLAPEVLREKVRLLYNCGQVILNTEQQACAAAGYHQPGASQPAQGGDGENTAPGQSG